MTKRTYAIMGATGNIGQILTEELLKKEHVVHAIGRDKTKLQKLKALGAEIYPISSFENSAELANAFKGVDAVFSFIPPGHQESQYDTFQDKVGEAIKIALIQENIPYVLNLSSIGAQHAEGGGPINGLHRQEKRLNTTPGLKVLHLRPGFFMENLEMAIPLIKKLGFNGSALTGDLEILFVSTADIGIKAAELLDRLNFKEQSIFEFYGPEKITMNQATKSIGKLIGKPDLAYQQLPFPVVEKGLVHYGIPPKSVKLLLEMYQSFNEGKIQPTQALSSVHRGKTTIDQYAQRFAKLYSQYKELASIQH